MKHALDFYLNTFQKIFSETANKYEAHMKSHVFLYRMAQEDEVIFEVFRRNLVKPGFFKQPSYSPDFLISLIDRPECSMSMSFFGPLPNHRTDYTYSTLHHHDDFNLSSISVKGLGYTSLIYKQGYEIEKESGEVKLELEKYCAHHPLNIEFIDKHTAHTIFYPSDISMTYALWSSYKPTSTINAWKKSAPIQKNKDFIKKLMKSISPDLKTIGITQYREDYFYPVEGKTVLLPGQIEIPLGFHFAQNVFHKLQYVKFDDRKFLEALLDSLTLEDRLLAEPWILEFLDGKSIPANYDGYAMLTPKRNVQIDEFRKCYSF